MIALLGLLSGIITGLSPCVLPILPVVLTAAAGGEGATPSRWRPYIVIGGLVTSFAVFTLAGGALISALGLPDDILRTVGLVLLALIGVGLLIPALGHLLERPFARIPMLRLRREGNGWLLGVGLGLVFVPCAGPILAAITVLAATGRVDGQLVLLTISFAAGVAVPLLFFALVGARLGDRIRRNRGRSQTLRKALGGVLVATSVVLALGLAEPLQRATPGFLADIQERIEDNNATRDTLDQLRADAAADTDAQNPDYARRASDDLGSARTFDQCAEAPDRLANCGPARSIVGIDEWFHTPAPLSLPRLRGKVVLLDFWTYSCINCQRTIPHLRALHDRYSEAGLTVVGVHTPEFPFEKVAANVRDQAAALGATYPVALDNDYKTWTNYAQRYWPAHYLIDRQGVVRQVHYGEGAYRETEQLVRQLLTEDGPGPLPTPIEEGGSEPDSQTRSPEMYLGANRLEFAVGQPIQEGRTVHYVAARQVPDDRFSFGGRWRVEPQFARSRRDARLHVNWQGESVNLVVGGRGIIRGTLNGEDVPEVPVSGAPRLYPVVTDRAGGTLDLRLSPGLEVYTLTFG